MQISELKLEELRYVYGDVEAIYYEEPGKKDKKYIVVRKPKLDEYMLFNKHMEIKQDSKGKQSYNLDPNYVDIYFNKIIVWPENVDITKIPVGIMVHACNVSIRLSPFEDENKLETMYRKSLESINTQIGATIVKLVSAFGIQAYKDIKYLDEEEIMDLIAIVETITDSYGDFAKIANIADNFPFNNKGKLDIAKLLGVTSKDNEPRNKMPDNKRKQLYQHYKSLNYSEDQIQQMIKTLEEKGRRFDIKDSKTQDGKVDMNRMSEEELSKMSHHDYSQMKKSGKLANHQESFQNAMEDAKGALNKAIEEDKRQYGDKPKPKSVGPQHYKGDFNKLISNIDNILKHRYDD